MYKYFISVHFRESRCSDSSPLYLHTPNTPAHLPSLDTTRTHARAHTRGDFLFLSESLYSTHSQSSFLSSVVYQRHLETAAAGIFAGLWERLVPAGASEYTSQLANMGCGASVQKPNQQSSGHGHGAQRDPLSRSMTRALSTAKISAQAISEALERTADTMGGASHAAATMAASFGIKADVDKERIRLNEAATADIPNQLEKYKALVRCVRLFDLMGDSEVEAVAPRTDGAPL